MIELQKFLCARKFCIACVQEQYAPRGSTLGLDPFLVLEKGPNPKAAIVLDPKGVGVLFMEHLSNEHCVVAQLSLGPLQLTVISTYFQYSMATEIFCEHLNTVLRSIGRGPVVICADANAQSCLWSSRRPNLRGEILEDFIHQNGLLVCNLPDFPATFSGPSGESDIDITLISSGLAGGLHHWRVEQGVFSSDHSAILFSVETQARPIPDRGARTSTLFKTRRPDWDRFFEIFNRKLDAFSKISSRLVCPNEMAVEFQSRLIISAEGGLGRVRPGPPKRNPWFGSRLEALRRGFRKARRDYQRAKNHGTHSEEVIEARRVALVEARCNYNREVKRARRTHFREYVTRIGNSDPWGAVYKSVRNPGRPFVFCALKNSDGSYTGNIRETFEFLMSSLFPDDDPDTDTVEQRRIRINSSVFPPISIRDPEIRHSELESIVKKLDPNKAPGIDSIDNKIIKYAWKAAGPEIVVLFNRCLRLGHFPKIWKEGKLKVIPKSNGRSPSDPKFYRPITLLPAFGKLLERVIAARLMEQLSHSPGSAMQFGFRPGVSTTDAISAALNWVDACPDKYVLGVFLDISGAFDNAWWPAILSALESRGVSSDLRRLIQDYFRDRVVFLQDGETIVKKTLTRGCPQGSVLGPILWNVVFDGILAIPLPGCGTIAYADDTLLMVGGASRREIENRAADSLARILDWGTKNKLSFAPQKSVAVLFKGRLAREPTVVMGGARIGVRDQVTYLGMVLDSRRSFMPQARYIGERARVAFHAMARLAGAGWGLNTSTLKLMYTAIYLGILAYAPSVWAPWCVGVQQVRRVVLRSQRAPLMALTKAYRTCSTDALPVLAGLLPADLAIVDRAANFELARGRSFSAGVIQFEYLVDEPLALRKRRIFEIVCAHWQSRWVSPNSKGETTRLFFPTVLERLEKNWLNSDYFTSQFLTGHGAFRASLFRFALRDSPACSCGFETQDMNHVMFDCREHSDARRDLLESMRQNSSTVESRDIVGRGFFSHRTVVENRLNFAAFKAFAKLVLEHMEVLNATL